ncbi:hypothetical protein Tco_0177356 [Tanacetum coccineum]
MSLNTTTYNHRYEHTTSSTLTISLSPENTSDHLTADDDNLGDLIAENDLLRQPLRHYLCFVVTFSGPVMVDENVNDVVAVDDSFDGS